jgi:hypothetical protein
MVQINVMFNLWNENKNKIFQACRVISDRLLVFKDHIIAVVYDTVEATLSKHSETRPYRTKIGPKTEWVISHKNINPVEYDKLMKNVPQVKSN